VITTVKIKIGRDRHQPAQDQLGLLAAFPRPLSSLDRECSDKYGRRRGWPYGLTTITTVRVGDVSGVR